jgi:hypothetical protein
MVACPGVLELWSQSVRRRGARAALAARSARRSRPSWMHAALAAAGRTSPSRSNRGCAGLGGAGADAPRRAQAQATRGVHAFAHAWRHGEGSVEPSRGAPAAEHDESGNSISQAARWSGPQLREAACAIASECPLLSSCGHWRGCPRLHKSGHWRPASTENSRGYRARNRSLSGIECPLCRALDALGHRGHEQRSAGAAAALRDGPRQCRRASSGAIS